MAARWTKAALIAGTLATWPTVATSTRTCPFTGWPTNSLPTNNRSASSELFQFFFRFWVYLFLLLFVLFEFFFSLLFFLKILAVHAIPVLVQEEDVVCPAPNTNATTSSRPSSQLSQNGSSGYGSTRSQVGPFGTSNRPSPSSESSSAGESEKNNPKKKSKSVWFMRGQRSGSSAELRAPETAKTRGNPQYASLRIPNRIRRLSYEDRGMDLAEAEVDSDMEEKCYPLRHASSLEAQVNIHFFVFHDIH